MSNEEINFIEKFIRWMEEDYEIKLKYLEKSANSTDTTSGDLMFKFLILAYTEYIEGNDILRKRNFSWS
tara:strand:- start:1056 stop:1262 length:207 start_codon:yes stop_codon:yes gene_type:complete